MTDVSAERWLPVVGYEGSYEVSSRGRVRSLDRVTIRRDGIPMRWVGRELKQKYNQHYYRLGLTKAGVTKNFCVHRLVCEAFHGPKPEPKSVVRHLNGKHLDNRSDNVTWGTCAENTADMVRHGRAFWTNQTHCIHGHEFTPENTRMSPGRNQRNCRACARVCRAERRVIRKRQRLASRPFHFCRSCGTTFQTAYRQTLFCSKPCKDASRRVGFAPREAAA